MQVVSTHQLESNFAITMLPVAEKNPTDLLDEIDGMKEGVEKTASLSGCRGGLVVSSQLPTICA